MSRQAAPPKRIRERLRHSFKNIDETFSDKAEVVVKIRRLRPRGCLLLPSNPPEIINGILSDVEPNTREQLKTNYVQIVVTLVEDNNAPERTVIGTELKSDNCADSHQLRSLESQLFNALRYAKDKHAFLIEKFIVRGKSTEKTLFTKLEAGAMIKQARTKTVYKLDAFAVCKKCSKISL